MLFKEVIGQHKIKKVLIESVKSERISHAQLFYGKEGYGALPLLIAYAQYIFCANKTNNDSCGECSSCKKINALSHPDLHFSFPVQLSTKTKLADDFIIEWKEIIKENKYFTEEDWYAKIGNENKKGVIGKDESQQIFKKLQLKSYEGNYKIVIIWQADKMNTSAANKLLKLIEEPPEKTLFLLTANSISTILPTIISRTQITKLKNLKENEIANGLIELKNVETQLAKDIASYVSGNFSEALKQIKGNEHEAEYFDLFVNWMRICFARDISKAIDISSQLSSIGREKQKYFILFSLSIFQKSLRGNFVGINEVHVNPSQKAFVNKFMPFITPNNAFILHKHLTDAHYHIDRNANAKILFLDLSFKLFSVIKK